MNKKPHIFIDEVEHKFCGKCHSYKNLTSFGLDNKRYDNLCPTCKDCKKKGSIIYRNKNRDKIRKYGINRYYNNRDKLLKQSINNHYKRSCDMYGGEELYSKIRKESKYKNRLNEHITLKILTELFPDTIIDHDYRIDTPKLSNRNFIKVDFYIIIDNRRIIVEYNGGQHYKINKHFFGDNAQERYEDQIKRDRYLRKYCNKNNIKLIEIDGRIIRGYEQIKSYLMSTVVI